MSKSTRRRRSSSCIQPEKVNLMTPKTKDFIQKICYKKTASVDMTKYGFITESRMGPINVYIKPLREQIQKIIDASKNNEDKTIIRSRRSVLSADPSPETQLPFSVDSSTKKYLKSKFHQKSVEFSL